MADSEIRITANASPAIGELDKLTKAADKSDQSIESLTKATSKLSLSMKDNLVASSSSVVSATKNLIKEFDNYSKKTTKVDTELARIKNTLRDWNSLTSKNSASILNASSALDSYSLANDRVKKSIDSFKSSNSEMVSSLSSVQKVVEKTSDDFLGYQTRIKAISESGRATARDLSALKDILSKVEVRYAAMNKAQSELPTSSAFGSSASDLRGISAQLREASAAATNLTAAQNAAETSITKLQNKYMKVGDSLAVVRGEFDKLNEKSKEFPIKEGQVKKLEKEYSILGNSLDKMVSKYLKIADAAKVANVQQSIISKELSIAGSGTASLKLDVSGTKAAIEANRELASQIRETAKSAIENSAKIKLFGDGLLGLGSSAKSVIYSLNALRIAFSLLFAASGIGAGVALLANYDQELANLKALTWDATKPVEMLNYEMIQLDETAQKLGATTRFTATEVATAMTYMAQAGLNSNQIISATADVLNLAVAGSMDLANASDIVVKSMTMFNYEASQAGQITDVLAAGANKSVTNVEELAYALKYVGPVAHTMNVNLNDTVAALGALSNAGINASMAGTGLRRIISEIINPTKKAADILEKAGLTMDKLDIAGKGLIPVIQNIADANLSMGETFAIWGDRGAPVLRAMINNMDDLIKLQKDLSPENIIGYAENLAKIKDDNLLGGWKNFVSAVQDFIIKTGDATGATDGLKNSLFAFADALRSFNADLSNTGPTFLAVTAAIATFLISMGKVKDVTGALGTQDAMVRRWALSYELLSAKTSGLKASISGMYAQLVSFISVTKGATTAITLANVATVAWTGAINVLRGAMALLMANAPMLIITGLVTAITYFTTRTSEAEHATEKYAASMKLLETSGLGAEKVISDFEEKARSLSKTELQIAQDRTAQRIEALKQKFVDLVTESDKMNYISIGVDSEQFYSNVTKSASSLEEVNKALEVYQNMDLSSKSESEKTSIEGIIGTLKTLKLAWMEANAQKKQYAETTAPSEMGNVSNAMLVRMSSYSAMLKELDLKDLYTETDKLDKKFRELGSNLPTEESREFYSVLQKFDGLESVFDIDPTNMTVKIKEAVKQMDLSLRTIAMESGDTKTIHMLDTLWEALNKNSTALNTFADNLKKVKEAKIDDNIRKLGEEFEYMSNNISNTQIGDKIKSQLLSVFGRDVMSKYSLVYKDTFDEMMKANDAFFNDTSTMAQKVVSALRMMFANIQETQKQTIQSMIEKQNVLLSIPVKQRKDVQSFASSSGVDLKSFDTKSGQFTGENAELINKAYKNYMQLQKDQMNIRSSGAKKEAKFNQNIANQLEELKIKYKEYQLQVTGGYKGEIEEQKLALQMLKEKASLLTQAASAGISKDDPRITNLQTEIDKTYELLQLDAKRKIMEEQSLKPYERRAELAKEQGVSESSAELALLQVKMQLLNANQLLEQSEAGRLQKAHERQMLEVEMSNINQKRAEEAAQLELTYQNQVSWFTQIRDAQIAIYDLETQRLKKQLAIAEAAKDEYEVKRLQKELAINESKKSQTLGSDANGGGWQGFSDVISGGMQQGFNNLINNFNELQMVASATEGVFNVLTDSLVEFITTGEVDFKKMISDISKMVGEMFIKMAMLKTMQFMGGMFHDGGIIGQTTPASRAVNPMVFSGAPRYHDGSGTIGGLRADERPAILQTGERVLNRSETSDLGTKMSQMVILMTEMVQAQKESASTDSSGGTNVVIVDDNSKIDKYMHSADGSKAFIYQMNQNRQAVQNIAKGGRA